MILNKAKNAKRNIIFGSMLKIYQILLPFVFRSVITYTLGVQYLGLNSLFTSILQVLNLVELGIGSAMVFSMYKPIAENDEQRICMLMNLYKKYYRFIGLIILIIGSILTPFVPKLIHGSVPDGMNVYILYILNLLATVLTYWLFAYRNSILQAHQRQDVNSKVTLITDTIKYGLQLIALFVFKNYYWYVIFILLTQAINNIITAIISKKMYPQYSAKGELPKEEQKIINKRIGDLFTAKLGGTIVNSADTIIISAFLGLTMLAYYQNYYYIVSSIMAFIVIFNNSLVAGIGNSMIVKSKKENYKEFRTFTFIQFWIFGFCICCFTTLFQTFMKLWMGPESLLDYKIVIMLCIYFISYQYVQMLSVYKDAGGIWHEDRFRPLIAGLANLALNIILVQFIGLYGVVLSTIISVVCISAIWITANVFKYIFKDESVFKYVLEILLYLLVIIVAIVVVNVICYFVPDGGVWNLLLKALISTSVPNMIFALAYFKHPLFKTCASYLKRTIKGKTVENCNSLKNETKTGTILYKDKTKCCGCGLCAKICPVNAITMVQDEWGAVYPAIDKEKCVGCNKCINNCAFGGEKNPKTKEVFAAVNKDKDQLQKSSSGGVFSALASYFLKNNGVVVGATLDMAEREVYHIIIEKSEDIEKLQGSKYVQSNFSTCLIEVQKLLENGKNVLFSGTPCQVASFKKYFARYGEQITTLDLICHGTPGVGFFKDYISFVESKNKNKILELKFRDKKYGWGCSGYYKTSNENAEHVQFSANEASYYNLFLSGQIYRDSCYNCPYASDERTGDLTIGDYWGIEKYDKQLLTSNGGRFDYEKGISCVLCNTEKGKKLLKQATKYLECKEVDINNVKIRNSQLNGPVKITKERNKILKKYNKSGYKGVEKIFKHKQFKKKIKTKLAKIKPLKALYSKMKHKKD